MGDHNADILRTSYLLSKCNVNLETINTSPALPSICLNYLTQCQGSLSLSWASILFHIRATHGLRTGSVSYCIRTQTQTLGAGKAKGQVRKTSEDWNFYPLSLKLDQNILREPGI